jgi:hypothetical protein
VKNSGIKVCASKWVNLYRYDVANLMWSYSKLGRTPPGDETWTAGAYHLLTIVHSLFSIFIDPSMLS